MLCIHTHLLWFCLPAAVYIAPHKITVLVVKTESGYVRQLHIQLSSCIYSLSHINSIMI